MGALTDAPRPGAPRKVTDEQVEALVPPTLTEGPGQGSHWSTRAMATETRLSQSSVSRIWRAFGLKPHPVETWKLSTDPDFIGKVRDVVGLYMSPPEHALVLAVDELGADRCLGFREAQTHRRQDRRDLFPQVGRVRRGARHHDHEAVSHLTGPGTFIAAYDALRMSPGRSLPPSPGRPPAS